MRLFDAGYGFVRPFNRFRHDWEGGPVMEKIRHKGKTIVYFTYRGLEDDQIVRRIEENVRAVEEMVAQGERNILRLTDVRDGWASPEIFSAFRKAADRLRPHVKASAVVGVKGGRKVLLDMLNRTTGIGVRPFDDLEAAKDWLAEQADR